MNSVIDSLQTWARSLRATAPQPQAHAQDPVAWRLCAWPELPEPLRRARVLRLLSTMSVRPVNRQWMLWQSGLAPQVLDALLAQLLQAGAVKRVALPSSRAAVPATPLHHLV